MMDFPLKNSYDSLAGAGDFLLRAQKKVTKEKGAPVRRRYLAKLVADSTALLDRPGELRNSRTASALAMTVGGRFQRLG